MVDGRWASCLLLFIFIGLSECFAPTLPLKASLGELGAQLPSDATMLLDEPLAQGAWRWGRWWPRP